MERERLIAAAPRIEELRAENHQGDVAAKDIDWLCDVAIWGLRYRDAVVKHGAGSGAAHNNGTYLDNRATRG